MLKKSKLINSYLKRSTALYLKNIILQKRAYLDNVNVQKFDLLFDSYSYSIIKRMLQISELKRFSVSRYLRKKQNRQRFFTKSIIRRIAKKIKNELLLISPELLFLHIKAKS
jgi:hypothetical protein